MSASASDLATTFDTYRFYLQCICRIIHDQHGSWQGLARATHEQTQSLATIQAPDDAWIKRFWRIAWNTEFLLGQTEGDPTLLRINNQWAPIQAYYAVYGGAEVVGLLTSGSRPDSHRQALRRTTHFLLNRGITPYDKAYEGPRGPGQSQHQPRNFPSDLQLPSNLQRHDVDPLGMIATCLRAEHSNRIDDDWRNRRQDGYKYAFDPQPTGILHFLWRLRVKANYQNVDVFLAEATDTHVRGFSDSLKFLVTCTLTVFEVVTLRKCGREYFARLAQEYLGSNERAEGLRERCGYYEAAL